MKKTLIVILLLITIVSCTKENVNARLTKEKSSKELLMGKWYTNNPSIWVREFTPTQMIVNPGGATKKIVGLNDSIIYFERLNYYPGYTEMPYKINGDTLWLGSNPLPNAYFLRFKY